MDSLSKRVPLSLAYALTITDIRLVCLVHNTVLGAAGGAVINAYVIFVPNPLVWGERLIVFPIQRACEGERFPLSKILFVKICGKDVTKIGEKLKSLRY